jgi:hypothetical protein
VIREASLPASLSPTFTLPKLAVLAEARATERAPFAFDGVHIDLRGETPLVRLTWRQTFPWRAPSVPTCLRHSERCRLVSLDRREMRDDEEFTCV